MKKVIEKFRSLWSCTLGNGEIVAVVGAVAIAATLGYGAVQLIGNASKTTATKNAGTIQGW